MAHEQHQKNVLKHTCMKNAYKKAKLLFHSCRNVCQGPQTRDPRVTSGPQSFFASHKFTCTSKNYQ